MAYLIPGDLCDVQASLLGAMDHSIGTISACRIALVPRAVIERILKENGPLSRALWWSTLLDEAILREWLVTMGHRPANRRVAHLVCEMLIRARAVGLTDDDGFDLPVTQEDLADTMGMTQVHMNRTLQALRAEGLIESRGRRMIVNDRERLMAYADFDPGYLHQQNRRG